VAMVIEVDSSLRPANRTTYKNRKRTRHEPSPVPNKRVRVFRDVNDAYAYHPTSLCGERSPGHIYQGADASALSQHSQKPYPISPFQGSSNYMATTRKLAVPQFAHSDNTLLLSAASITNVKENVETLSSPSQMLVHPSATSSPFQVAKPIPLSSPFKGGHSRNSKECGPTTILFMARQVRTKSIQNLPSVRQSSFKQSRSPTIQSTGIPSSKPKQRTVSSTLTRTTERSRAASWLIPPPPHVPHSRVPQAITCVPVDQEHNNDRRSHIPQREEDESSPQSFGITSFFADAPDAFSTPVRPTRQKGEDNRTALTADQSFSSVSTPDAGPEADPLRSVSLLPLSPSSPSITVMERSQLGHTVSCPQLIAPPRQRAQRTADRLQTASSSLENSPMTHTPATGSVFPSLAHALPAISSGSPSAYARRRLAFPASPSGNNVPLTPASSPPASGKPQADLHRHHALNDTPTPYNKHILDNAQHSATAGATISSQHHQIGLESDMLSLTISDGLTIGPDMPILDARADWHPLPEIDQQTSGQHEAINRGRKKTKRTISQTDDEEIIGDDPNVLLDSCVRGCQANGNNEPTSGLHSQSHFHRGKTNIDKAPGKKSRHAVRRKALLTTAFSPALPIVDGGRDGYRRALMRRYGENGVDEESEDELLLKHGQTKRFVAPLCPRTIV
jgi:hypothetical protein